MNREKKHDFELLDLTPLPAGWEYVSLGNTVDPERGISYGVVQPGSNMSDGVPIVRVNNLQQGMILTDDVMRVAQNIENKYQRTRLRGGEVLLSLVGSLGQTSVVPDSLAGWNVARAVAVIPVLPDIGAKWVNFCLQSPQLQHFIRTWATTTVQATLNLGDVIRLPIPLPPSSERESISEILSSLDDKIELNRRMNTTLEALARALFERVKDESRRMIGWKTGKLGEVALNVRRGALPKDIQPETAYIGLEHMPRKSIALAEWGNVEEVTSNKFWFKRGEILFGKLRPYFHKVGVAPIDGVCSTDILVIAPKKPAYFGFVLGHISSDELVNHTDAASTGTKMPRTNWGDIARYEVEIPPVEVAVNLTEQILPLVQKIHANIAESRTLAALRDMLLPRLLSGEVRVKDVG